MCPPLENLENTRKRKQCICSIAYRVTGENDVLPQDSPSQPFAQPTMLQPSASCTSGSTEMRPQILYIQISCANVAAM